MPLDSFIDSPFNRLPEPSDRGAAEYCSAENENTRSNIHYKTYAPFQNAHNFVIQNATMIDRAEYPYSAGKSLMELLLPYTNPDAAMDSSARDPPPKCHPGTRIDIIEQLEEWLGSLSREYDMLWLYGPAGTGKSAIAQTFAELCAERNRLGAAFFFSRPNQRDKPESVIPSLTYQLAYYFPAYKSIISQTIVDDPQLLRKAVHVQFKRLIIEPFSRLQAQGHEDIRQPFLVLLDGLDECAGVRAQSQFINMISELVRLKRGFPILWLLCSRPESHLKHVFSRIPECGHLELLLDEGSREDVELFLRDSFAAIRDENPDIVPPNWPPVDQLRVVLRVASGLFVVASVAFRYVDDPASGSETPVERLNTLVAYLVHSERVGAKSPLAALDLLYFQILSDVPSKVFPMTRRVLVHLAFRSSFGRLRDSELPAQALCNMLQFDQGTFYNALRHLHSVLRVPSPESAAKKPLEFYHASFHDFLLEPSRSGVFTLKIQEIFAVELKTYMLWYQSDRSANYHDAQMQKQDRKEVLDHQLGSHPALTWALLSDQKRVSDEISGFVYMNIWFSFLSEPMPEKNDDLLSQIRHFDFRRSSSFALGLLTAWILTHYPLSGIVRTEPTSDVDLRLLDYLQIFDILADFKPVRLSLPKLSLPNKDSPPGQYCLLGCGQKACLFLMVSRPPAPGRVRARADLLNADTPPSEEFMSKYRSWLEGKSEY